MMHLNLFTRGMAFFKKIKFHLLLFVSTEPVGNNGYMNWDQIKEIDKRKFCNYWTSFSFT